MDQVDIALEKYQGTSKSGKKYDCFRLLIGDYETLLFPRSKMEFNYLTKVIDENAI